MSRKKLATPCEKWDTDCGEHWNQFGALNVIWRSSVARDTCRANVHACLVNVPWWWWWWGGSKTSDPRQNSSSGPSTGIRGCCRLRARAPVPPGAAAINRANSACYMGRGGKDSALLKANWHICNWHHHTSAGKNKRSKGGVAHPGVSWWYRQGTKVEVR